MKVKDLISVLSDMPQDFEVAAWCEGAPRAWFDTACVVKAAAQNPDMRIVVLFDKGHDGHAIKKEIDKSFPVVGVRAD